ncbi:MAG TPA: lytic transglycosylase domain-containing protein [Acetobacteraceae bacterium]|nr:lytic transglycosylase domain-containing protein [Acetobacteraceae bacterium]
MSPVAPVPLWLLALMLLTAPATAAQAVAPAGRCDQAAAAAERQYALPAGILAAIGRVETGRSGPARQAPHPWPWSLNADGAGSMAPTRRDAIARVRALRARGTQSIDVGCFQVNLLYHPGAFPTLRAAFDPFANARYAGRFLTTLRRRTGSWDAAIMAYHSAQPARGGAYRDKVLAVWSADLAQQSRLSGELTRTVVAGVAVYTPHTRGNAPAMLRLYQTNMNTPIIITPSS